MSLLPGRAAFTEVAWVVAGQAAAVVGSLALLRLLTTIMTPDEYGRLALGLTLAGLVGQAMTGGVANGIGRFRSRGKCNPIIGNTLGESVWRQAPKQFEIQRSNLLFQPFTFARSQMLPVLEQVLMPCISADFAQTFPGAGHHNSLSMAWNGYRHPYFTSSNSTSNVKSSFDPMSGGEPCSP